MAFVSCVMQNKMTGSEEFLMSHISLHQVHPLGDPLKIVQLMRSTPRNRNLVIKARIVSRRKRSFGVDTKPLLSEKDLLNFSPNTCCAKACVTRPHEPAVQTRFGDCGRCFPALCAETRFKQFLPSTLPSFQGFFCAGRAGAPGSSCRLAAVDTKAIALANGFVVGFSSLIGHRTGAV